MENKFKSLLIKNNMITRDDVLYIAKLSQLDIKDSELDNYLKHLQQILKYVEKLNEIDTSNVDPTAHVMAMQNVTREDEIKESVSNENALKSAPNIENGFFHVPTVIE